MGRTLLTGLTVLSWLAGLAAATVPATDDWVAYDGDGSDTTFVFNFGVWETSEVRVVVVDADGVETLQEENSDYTVTLPNDDGWLTPGGTVTFTTAPAATEEVWLFRDVGWLQGSSWSTATALDLNTLEDDFDRSVVRDRTLWRLVRRSLRSAETEATDMNLPAGWSTGTGVVYWDGSRWSLSASTVPDVAASTLWSGVLTQPTLTLSLDELGLGTAAGNLVLRGKYDVGTYNVRDYGAKGDGVTDDVAAIEAAITAAQAVNGCVEFPPGTYLILSQIDVGSTAPFMMRGSGSDGAVIKAGAAMDYMLYMNHDPYYTAFGQIENLYFNGNNLAEIGIYGNKFQHMVIERCRIWHTTVAAITFKYGWINRVEGCEIGYNDGHGIECIGSSPNACIWNNNNIYANEGWGAKIGSDYATIITGNLFEGNKKGGLFLGAQHGGLIAGNEFSVNGNTGDRIGMGDPDGAEPPEAVTPFYYHCNLALNGGVYSTIISNDVDYLCDGLQVTGNTFLYPSAPTSQIVAFGTRGVTISGNHFLNTDRPVPAIEIYLNRRFSDNTDLTIGTNSHDSADPLFLATHGFVDNNNVLDDAHTWSISGQTRKNYLDIHQDMTQWTEAVAVAGTTLSLSSTPYMGMPVYELQCDDPNSSRFEVGLNINTDYPELKSQLVWFGCWYKWDDDVNECNLQLYCDVDAGAAYYDVNYVTTEPSGWTFKSMMVKVPASDTDFRVGIRKLGDSDEPIYLCHPILTRVGNRYDSFAATEIAAHETVFDHTLIELEDVNNVTTDITNFDTSGVHIIDSSGGAITGAVAAGTATGQRVKFVCKTAGNNIDISVSNHVTSDPEVIRLDTALEWVELVWDGTDWVEVSGSGQTYP